MKSAQIVNAASLLEQLSKLNTVLRDSPPNPDTLTITFRKGSDSKSVSLKDRTTLLDVRKMVEQIRDDTIKQLVDLGVEIEDGYS